MKSRLLLIFLSLCLLLTSCPEPPDSELECGDHQIEINGTCECEEGYHWNEDETQCLLDTTSHAFTWEVDTLGEFGSSLKDVAIIDENNVWTVGEISIGDVPSGNYETYGAAIWDGDNWNLKKLVGEGISVQSITPRGIWYFEEDNIWFASGSIYHWNGDQTTLEWLRDIGTDETVEKVWGSSPSNIYFVGNEGTIVHYNGSSFTKMESGTDKDLWDIEGAVDSETGEVRIWVAGSGVLLSYENNTWQVVFENDSGQSLGGVTFTTARSLYVPDTKFLLGWLGWLEGSQTTADAGAWQFNQLNHEDNKLLFMNNNIAGFAMDGNWLNDFFVVGQGLDVIHYNGYTMRDYPELQGDVWLESVDQFEDQVFIVGWLSFPSQQAIVFRGIKQ